MNIHAPRILALAMIWLAFGQTFAVAQTKEVPGAAEIKPLAQLEQPVCPAPAIIWRTGEAGATHALQPGCGQPLLEFWRAGSEQDGELAALFSASLLPQPVAGAELSVSRAGGAMRVSSGELVFIDLPDVPAAILLPSTTGIAMQSAEVGLIASERILDKAQGESEFVVLSYPRLDWDGLRGIAFGIFGVVFPGGMDSDGWCLSLTRRRSHVGFAVF